MSELVVHHLSGAWGLPSVSPFCLKLDAFLRMTKIPHKAVTAPTPFAGPKRKAPWIDHEGKSIGDSASSSTIVRAGVDPDAHSHPRSAGPRTLKRPSRKPLLDHGLRSLDHRPKLEAVPRGRIERRTGADQICDRADGGRSVRASCWARYGRHTSEIHRIGIRDVAALPTCLAAYLSDVAKSMQSRTANSPTL
jgi:hypothetical protein